MVGSSHQSTRSEIVPDNQLVLTLGRVQLWRIVRCASDIVGIYQRVVEFRKNNHLDLAQDSHSHVRDPDPLLLT